MIFVILVFVSISLNIQIQAKLEPEGRIVGGYYAEPHQFPWQVAIYLNYIRIFKCGGTIIHKRWVLTAAHCVGDGGENDFLILAGTNINSLGSGSVHSVSKIILHENFVDFRNDIALIKISDQFKLDHMRKIIELGSHVIPDGDPVITSGWGRESSGGNLPTKLKWIELQKMNDRDCVLFTENNDGIICLLSPENKGVCSGDSGGPAVHNGKIVGVANFVISTCGSKFPDGYARVATYVNWIESHLKNN